MYSRTILGNRLRYRVPLNCFGPVNRPNLPDLPCSLKKCGRSVGFPHSRGGPGSPQWDHGEEDSEAGDTPRIGNAGALHAHSSREHATRYELAPRSGLENSMLTLRVSTPPAMNWRPVRGWKRPGNESRS